jgi:Nuclease-related domain
MTGKRGDDGRICLCDRPDGTCAGLAVRRLSLERVRELAEEIWTASSGTPPPARSGSDPRSSRAGASAQAAFARRREQERRDWRLGWAWWTAAVIGVDCAGTLLIGLTVGAWLAWPMGLLLAAWTGWRLRFRPSEGASIWRRQAAMQRRTAAVLAPLADEGYLVLHDVALPGWLDSLDHVVVGRTGVWVLTSWRRRLLPAGGPSPTGTLRGLLSRTHALAEALDGWARVPVRPLLCVHGRWSRRVSRSFLPIRVAPLGQLPDAIGAGPMATPDQVELASARLLERLRPAA